MNPYREPQQNACEPTDRIVWQKTRKDSLVRLLTKLSSNDDIIFCIILTVLLIAVIVSLGVMFSTAPTKVVTTYLIFRHEKSDISGWTFLITFLLMSSIVPTLLYLLNYANDRVCTIRAKIKSMIVNQKYTPELWGLIYQLSYLTKGDEKDLPIALRYSDGILLTKYYYNPYLWEIQSKEQQDVVRSACDVRHSTGMYITRL